MDHSERKSDIEGADYHDSFDPHAYLQKKFPGQVLEWHPEVFESFHDLFQSFPSSSIGHLKVLDYGTGPTLAFQISAAEYASEIILAEYTEKNREALQLWLNGDARAYNWAPYFKYVVQTLEGKSEQEAASRQEQLRKVVKAVVPCDISRDDVIERGYEGPYDVIISSLCLQTACATKEEYKAAMPKLLRLLKPGGKIALLCAASQKQNQPTSYCVGSARFHDLFTSEEFTIASLQEAGFCDTVSKRMLHGFSATTTVLFITASRKS